MFSQECVSILQRKPYIFQIYNSNIYAEIKAKILRVYIYISQCEKFITFRFYPVSKIGSTKVTRQHPTNLVTDANLRNEKSEKDVSNICNGKINVNIFAINFIKNAV